MAKKSKTNRIKLPKRLLGVKLPKQSRKNLNRILKGVSSAQANPLVAAAVGSFVTLLAERLEQPLQAIVDHPAVSGKPRPAESVAKH